MAVTFNKDGKPRKKGSGKTKGAGCYAKIPWSDLKKFIGPEVFIPVSRVWLRNLNPDLDKYVDPSQNPLQEDSLNESPPPSPGPTDPLPQATPETSKSVEQTLEIPEPEPLRSDDSSDFVETEIPSVSEKDAEKALEEEEDSQPKQLVEDKEVASGNSLAGIAYRYSQNFDL